MGGDGRDREWVVAKGRSCCLGALCSKAFGDDGSVRDQWWLCARFLGVFGLVFVGFFCPVGWWMLTAPPHN